MAYRNNVYKRDFIKNEIKKLLRQNKNVCIHKSNSRKSEQSMLYMGYEQLKSINYEIYSKSICYDIDTCIYENPTDYIRILCYKDLPGNFPVIEYINSDNKDIKYITDIIPVYSPFVL